MSENIQDTSQTHTSLKRRAYEIRSEFSFLADGVGGAGARLNVISTLAQVAQTINHAFYIQHTHSRKLTSADLGEIYNRLTLP